MTKEEIKEQCKNTVGYNECADKESFMVGASVALNKYEKFHNETIKALNQLLNNRQSELRKSNADIKTIVDIIKKYS